MNRGSFHVHNVKREVLFLFHTNKNEGDFVLPGTIIIVESYGKKVHGF